MNKRTKKIGAVLCIVLVMTGAMVWWMMSKPKSTYEGEQKTFLVDVFHWGFATASASDPQTATNSLDELGLPTTTLKVNENDVVVIIFRNAETVPVLREKYSSYMDRALAAANLTPEEWTIIKSKSPAYSGYLITVDCFCGVVSLGENEYSASFSFTAPHTGEIGFRTINALKMVPMAGNIVIS
jgi:hypothetical protein